MNKPVYLGSSVLYLSKTVMYEFWYDYVKPKHGRMQNFVIWIQTDSLYIYIKTKDIYKDVAEDVGTRLDTSKFLN